MATTTRQSVGARSKPRLLSAPAAGAPRSVVCSVVAFSAVIPVPDLSLWRPSSRFKSLHLGCLDRVRKPWRYEIDDGETTCIGPDGERMTFADLPPPDTRRWVPRRKAKVVAAIEGGLIEEADALRRYGLSPEEIALWRTALRRHGMRGLCVTRLGDHRRASE
ncbi:MAG: DUF1153 domain-containing protein [Pseudomonadota bacterium]